MTMARTIRTVQNGPWTPVLYTTPDKFLTSSLGGVWPSHLARQSQGVGDLTARLNKGLREAPTGPVLFIGSDAPDLHPRHIQQAFKALRNHQAVFGPASDGGFWLFGLNKTARTPSPFENCRWSGPHAMEDVWGNLPRSANVALLPELIDIDDADDWKTWRASKIA